MAIKFLCSNPECRTNLEVGDQLAGKKARCPRCKTVNVAPEAGAKSGDTGSGVAALDAFLEEKRGRRAPFDVEKEIAHGGMGAVILARDKAIQRELAVKVMRPQIADSEEHRLRFLEEAQVTGQLEHPNIVPIHELGKDAEGNLYFTMKLVKGKSLGELLKELKSAGVRENGSMGEKRPDKTARAQTPTPPHSHTPTLPDLLGVFLKVCDGIAFAHSKGVIHRDLKPDNIMVGEFGEVQIMDWGLAKVVGASCQLAASGEQVSGVSVQVSGDEQPGPSDLKPETRNLKPDAPEAESAIRRADTVRSVRSESDVALTVDGQITGTPAYMPPEQAEGKLEMIDHRSDVYSLGAILYEVLTLERPIEGDTIHKVLLNVADGNITPPEQRTPGRHIPKELSAVVMKAMAKNRRKRYQSVQDLSQDIKLFLEGRSVSAREDSFAESAVKLVKRNKGISVAVGIAAGLLLSVVMLFVFRLKGERDRAVASEQRATESEEEAVKARNRMQANALETSRQLAEQAVRAAEQGRWTEAEVRADAAGKLAPEGPWGAYALGTVAKEKKDLGTAEEHYRTALKNDPAHKESQAALAQVLSAMGKINEATALLSGQRQVQDWHTLKTAGDTLYEAERYREAEKAYTEALAQLDHPQRVPKDAKDWRSLIAVADALLAGKFHPDAKAAYERAITLMESAKAVPTEAPELTRGKLKQAEDGLSRLKEEIENARGEAWAWVKCEGFSESIQALPAEEQFARIEAKFDEIHGKRVTSRHEIAEGVLREVKFTTDVTYLQPLKGVALRSLLLSGTKVRNLSPLRGMPLTALDLSGTRVSDLTALTGMPLTSLNLRGMLGVSDLAPLKDMPLTHLDLTGTKVQDLAPLRGIPLKSLNLRGIKVDDLGPLVGMPLTSLLCLGTQVSDLSPLEGMPLTFLECTSTGVSDLSPLKGMPLTTLECGSTGVSDLSPLKGMSLKGLSCAYTQVSDLSSLEGMPLTRLDCTVTQVKDLSPLKGMPLTTLSCDGTQVSDLSPLKGMPLTSLDCDGTQVSDLSPLKGMSLKVLSCARTRVSDLSPLRGMPLRRLRCDGTQVSDLRPVKAMPLGVLTLNDSHVTDLTPLEGMKLTSFGFTPKSIGKGIEIIRQMRTVRMINPGGRWSMSPEEFWKKYDAGEFK